MHNTIEENLKEVQGRIRNSCERVGRNPAEITLIAATKNVPPDRIKEAVKCGIKIIGENRVQEALSKYESIKESVRWHMIGHLQTNKVKKAIELFEMIQSVDSMRLAEEIQKRASNAGKVMDILVEVNTSQEETKYGLNVEETVKFLKRIHNFDNIRVKGLMTIGFFTQDPEKVRPCFKTLRNLKRDAEEAGIELEYLSMGMSSDFEVAIEEGSNIVRIGTLIFGKRD